MVAVAIGGAAVLGAGATVYASSQSSKAASRAAQQANDTQQYMYDQTRADQAPYRTVGYGALNKLADMYGVPREVSTPSTGAPASPATGLGAWPGIINAAHGGASSSGAAPTSTSMTPGYSGFQASPGYQFRMDQGLKAIERSAAARGGLRSGATMKSLNDYAQGTASSEFENYANRLAALAGVGQSATNSTSAAGQNMANNVSANQMAAGQARASAYQNVGSAINGGVQNVASAYLYNQGFGGGQNFSNAGVGSGALGGSGGAWV